MAHQSYSSSDLSFSPHVRSCDVFIGHCSTASPRRRRGQCDLELRFVKWLCAELEMQGLYSFVSDRSTYDNAVLHAAARTAMEAASLGVIVVSRKSFSNPFSMEELQTFLECRNLVPVFFDLTQVECSSRDVIEKRGDIWENYGGRLWMNYGGIEKDWVITMDGISQTDIKIEANGCNMRDSILQTVEVIGKMLGKRKIIQDVAKWKDMVVKTEELLLSRNTYFVGREKELLELEKLLFGERENIDGRIQIGLKDDPMINERLAKEIKGKVVMEEIRVKEFVKNRSLSELLFHYGIACVTGEPGIGKTELLLEFAYRFAQRYKMVLWINGEAKHLQRNYVKLLPLLGVDFQIGNDVYEGRNTRRRFDDMEAKAISKVRNELSRDIPFLLIIDNLDSEKDWWNGLNFRELLPFSKGKICKTHVMISTRLSHVLNIRPLRLRYMSRAEAFKLMSISSVSTDNRNVEVGILRKLEEKLGRLPLGLSIVGAVLSECHLDPAKLLEIIDQVNDKEYEWNSKEELMLKRNPFLVQLLDVLFSYLYQAEKSKKIAAKMVELTECLASSLVPTSLLAMAAHCSLHDNQYGLWKGLQRAMVSMCKKNVDMKALETRASSILVRFRFARSTTKMGSIQVHDLVKLYAGKRRSAEDENAIVRAIMKEGFVIDHLDHIWAACFLLFRFSTDATTFVNLHVLDLMSFIKQLALPLAIHCFNNFSQCTAALDLLRLSTEALELAENNFLCEARDNSKRISSCSCSSNQSSNILDPLIYQEFANLKATLLETRAKLLLHGGMLDIAHELCIRAVSIKEVIYGSEHPNTISTLKIIERLRRNQ